MNSVDLNWKTFMEKRDEASFSIIYNNHVDNLYAYGISLGFQKEMCKDAIQDTFYKLYVCKNNLSHIDNIIAYIFKSFKHRLIDLSRKILKEEILESASESFTVNVTVLDDMIESEKADILKKKVSLLLDGLTDNQREVVYLKYMIGLEHKEIADVLDIREESARKLLYRTMEKLRQQTSEDDFREVLSILLTSFLFQRFF